ncbi:ABC transporter ATP-binding protein [Alcaligenaceae bacterium]|nr:ABC transporter ATP-binding protein [Alcaligenaceae bacterium]
MMDQPVIRTDQLYIGYAGRRVGTDISLSIAAHEVLCLLGPNGSGKSTLFKTMLGLIPPLSGKVWVQGKAISQWSRKQLAQQVAYVPQAHAGVFPFTVEEVVLMGRSARLGSFSSPARHDRDIAMHSLEQMGIAHLSQRVYTAISGGERQLTLIARALAQEPVLMVMDEPTASLDFGNQIRVLQYIQKMRAGGMGILLCTHQPDHALQVSDRIALFKQGKIHHIGPPQTTATLERLAWLYDLDVQQVSASLPMLAGMNVANTA